MASLRFPNVEIVGLLSFQFERNGTISDLKNKFNLGLQNFAFTLDPATIVETKENSKFPEDHDMFAGQDYLWIKEDVSTTIENLFVDTIVKYAKNTATPTVNDDDLSVAPTTKKERQRFKKVNAPNVTFPVKIISIPRLNFLHPKFSLPSVGV